jgi:serine/threonine-protein kinase
LVAFKRVRAQFRADQDVMARIRREIDVQSSITHPNIMPILDHSEKFYWYTMPIAATSVGKLSTPVDDETLCQIIEDCANGLAFAHGKRCIHRDLTPNNVLYLDDGSRSRWVVADWGLVRRLGKTSTVYTAQGQSFGTAGFSAPETWYDAHDVDESADVYGLGRVVAWCVTGRWPSPNVPLLPDGKWFEFVDLTTKFEPTERIQYMSEVLRLLEKVRAEREKSTD